MLLVLAEQSDAHLTRLIKRRRAHGCRFFTLSGFLIGHVCLKELEETGGRLDVRRFLSRRWLRIAPAYAAAMLFSACLSAQSTAGCAKSWWWHALFVSKWRTARLGGV